MGNVVDLLVKRNAEETDDQHAKREVDCLKRRDMDLYKNSKTDAAPITPPQNTYEKNKSNTSFYTPIQQQRLRRPLRNQSKILLIS